MRPAVIVLLVGLLSGCATTGRARCVPAAADAGAGVGLAAGRVAAGLWWPAGLVVLGAGLLWEGGSELVCRAARSRETAPEPEAEAPASPTEEAAEP